MKIQGNLSVSVFKSKSGKKVVCLKCDLGYTQKIITFDMSLIAEILGLPIVELYNLDYGSYDLAI